MTEAHPPLGLHARDLGDILNAGVELCRRSFRSLLLAAAVPLVPVVAISGIVQALADDDFGIDESTDRFGATVVDLDVGAFAFAMGATLGAAALSLVASSLASGACTKVVAGAFLGEDIGWRESLRFATARLASLVGLALLAGLGMALGFLALVIPGIYLFAAWIVATPALLLEGGLPGRALGRSRQLVRGRWWSTAGLVLIASLLTGVVSALFTFAVQLPFLADDPTAMSTSVGIVGGVIASLLVTPFTAAVYVVLYFDLRVRKEGFDLYQLAASIGLPPPAGGVGYIPPPPPFPGPQR